MTAPQPDREQEIRTRAELRQQLAAALHKQGAYCGECNFEDESETCPDCIKVRSWYVDAVLPVLDAAVAAEVRRVETEANLTLLAETTKLRGLLAAENRRANAAIEREETAEEAADELRADRDAAVAAAVRRALEDAARKAWAQAIAETPKGWSERYVGGWNDAISAVTDGLRSAAVASPAREQGEGDFDRMTPQSCSKGFHADWAVDSEDDHTCPWCRIAELEARTATPEVSR